MKRFLILFILIMTLSISSCKAKKLTLDEIYGNYVYEECIYISPLARIEVSTQTEMYSGISSFKFSSKKYSQQRSSLASSVIHIAPVEYREKDIDFHVTEKAVKKLLRRCTTRFDVYKYDVNQGYAILSDGKNFYFMETRLNPTDNEHYVYELAKIKLREKTTDK